MSHISPHIFQCCTTVIQHQHAQAILTEAETDFFRRTVTQSSLITPADRWELVESLRQIPVTLVKSSESSGRGAAFSVHEMCMKCA